MSWYVDKSTVTRASVYAAALQMSSYPSLPFRPGGSSATRADPSSIWSVMIEVGVPPFRRPLSAINTYKYPSVKVSYTHPVANGGLREQTDLLTSPFLALQNAIEKLDGPATAAYRGSRDGFLILSDAFNAEKDLSHCESLVNNNVVEFSATTDEEWCESLQTKLIEELAKNEEYQSFINMRCPGAMANKRKKPLDFTALEPRSASSGAMHFV